MKESCEAGFCAANASLLSDKFLCVCVRILAERFYIIGKFVELSYDMNKNLPLADSPPAAGRPGDILPFRRSAILPGGLFVS